MLKVATRAKAELTGPTVAVTVNGQVFQVAAPNNVALSKTVRLLRYAADPIHRALAEHLAVKVVTPARQRIFGLLIQNGVTPAQVARDFDIPRYLLADTSLGDLPDERN